MLPLSFLPWCQGSFLGTRKQIGQKEGKQSCETKERKNWLNYITELWEVGAEAELGVSQVINGCNVI